MTQMRPSSGPRPLLDAYRAASTRQAVALDDGSWLRIGTLLEHAALLPPGERGAHLEQAAQLVREVIGESSWRAGHPTDPEPPSDERSLEGRLRVYCHRIEDAGALEVADAI